MPILDHRDNPHDWVIKTYALSQLLDDDWKTRVASIEKWSNLHPYPVYFSLNEKTLNRFTRKLPPKSQKILAPSKSHIRSIATQLSSLHAAGLTHGDVHAKNIWWDGKEAVLLDFEPSLLQLIGERPCLMGTAPRIHKLDRQQLRLSVLTDQLAFVMWAYKLDLKKATALLESRKNWQELSHLNF